MTDQYEIITLEDVDQEEFPESGIPHRQLTDPLGCTDMRVNAMRLRPGQSTSPHSHERQEEVYVALDGGHVQIDGDTHEVAPGGVVRVGPEPLRCVRNESEDETQTWIMFGAPPHGTVEDFGEYAMPEE